MKPRFSTSSDCPSSLRRHAFPLLVSLALFCLLLPACWASEKSTAPIDDVRVLIDISGSMKRTDPQNLRRPALRLFTSLLPKGAEAGVWTFGQWTNMLAKHGPVDTAWKDTARKAADEISSHGLRTNIEDVLRRATWDWKRPDENHRRSLILLTDGLVDISKKADENAASRERILNEILPQLQQAGVTVHTIALSSESDAPLLQQLAAATGGWFETIDTASGLERLFLRMFEKVQVPILGIIENMSTFTCPHCGKDTDIFRSGGGARMSEELSVPYLSLSLVNQELETVVEPGEFEVMVGSSSRDQDLLRATFGVIG